MKQKIKKLDEVEVSFVDKPWAENEREAFSVFLKTRHQTKVVKSRAGQKNKHLA